MKCDGICEKYLTQILTKTWLSLWKKQSMFSQNNGYPFLRGK